MGFAAGLTGGVALTLAVAYLTTAGQQIAREEQSLLLQQSSRTLDEAIDHPAAPRRPTRAELAAAARANFKDRAKDKWNADVEGAVRWLQSADWERAREKVEEKVGVLAEVTAADEAAGKLAAAARARGVEVKEGLGHVVDNGLAKVKEVAGELGHAVGDAAEAEAESDVRKALRQRYEGTPADARTRTVSEVLKERYIPMGQRDNTVLRGL